MPQVNAGYPALEGDAVDAIVDATVRVAAQRLSGDLSVAETERLTVEDFPAAGGRPRPHLAS